MWGRTAACVIARTRTECRILANMSDLKTPDPDEPLPNPEEIEGQLQRLVGVLVESSVPQDKWAVQQADQLWHHAGGFAFKLCRHAGSVLTLVRQYSSIGVGQPKFLDCPSVSILARAGWECFLLFHHIFIDVADHDERRMRHRRWLIDGVRARQGYAALNPDQESQKKDEIKMIGAWEAEVRANPAFLRFCPDCRKHFLKRQIWHDSWADLGDRAHIGKLFGHDHYSHLCDYAHSGSLSVVGQKDEQDPESVRSLRVAAAGLLAIAVANVIMDLATLFPGIGKITDPDELGLVKYWIDLGHGPEPNTVPA